MRNASNYNLMLQLMTIPVLLGCTDSDAFNFSPNATDDDGSCVAVTVGCMDSLANNYYISANIDDGREAVFIMAVHNHISIKL